jgi:sporulation protein YlmC with PRC-barrel domain
MVKRFLEQIKGAEVVGSGGLVFGNVADLELSQTNLSGLIVAVKNSHVVELGLTKPFWSAALVVIPVEFIKSIADVAVLSMTLEEFAKKLSKVKSPSGRLEPKLATSQKVSDDAKEKTDRELEEEFSVPWQEE